jgi:integrase
MTARRRGKGEGSIYRRASDGRWVAALIMEDGRRVVRRARSRKDAATKLELLLKARAEDQTIAAHQSTSAFLSEWLAVVKNTVAPGTFERYEQYIRVHALPALGRIKLGRLTPQHFQRLYQEKLAAGLSPTTVNHLHTVLHGAFAEAVRWGLVPRNVVALVRPPRNAHIEIVALTVEQARALLAAAAGNRFEALFILALKTGMRRRAACPALGRRRPRQERPPGPRHSAPDRRRAHRRHSKDRSIPAQGGAVAHLGGGTSTPPSTPG